MVVDVLDTAAPVFLGGTSIKIHSAVSNMMVGDVLEEQREDFPVYNLMGTLVGRCAALCRITRLGPGVADHLATGQPKPPLLSPAPPGEAGTPLSAARDVPAASVAGWRGAVPSNTPHTASQFWAPPLAAQPYSPATVAPPPSAAPHSEPRRARTASPASPAKAYTAPRATCAVQPPLV